MLKVVVTWFGGPMDGRRVPVNEEATEYAVAYNDRGEILDHPGAQRYLDDPAYWMKDRFRSVGTVRVYDIEYDPDTDSSVIAWHEREFRIIEVSSNR